MAGKTLEPKQRLGVGSRVSVKASYFGKDWARKIIPQTYDSTRIFGNIVESRAQHKFVVKFDIFEELPDDPVHVTRLKAHDKDEGREIP